MRKSLRSTLALCLLFTVGFLVPAAPIGAEPSREDSTWEGIAWASGLVHDLLGHLSGWVESRTAASGHGMDPDGPPSPDESDPSEDDGSVGTQSGHAMDPNG